jgi:hypothetical protein
MINRRLKFSPLLAVRAFGSFLDPMDDGFQDLGD